MEKQVLPPPPVERIPLDWIRPSPERRYYGVNRLSLLAERMRNHGLVDPIVVRRVQDSYEIIDGTRRWWAAKMLGWRSIDVKIVTV